MRQVTFSAAAATTIGSDRPFNVAVDVPDGYSHRGQVASGLLYPIEVAAISNWEIPDNGANSDSLEAWPRIDLMPDSGVLLWILQGDVSFDYEAMPAQGDWFDPATYTYLGIPTQADSAAKTAPTVVASERGVSGADKVGSPWPSCDMWGRLTPLAAPDGATPQYPPYLMLYAFAGKNNAPVGEVNEMISSLEVSYN